MVLSKYFSLKRYGLLELIVVLYPILKQYTAPIISVGDWLLFLAGLSCFFKAKRWYKCTPLLVLIGYIIIHEILVAIAMGGVPMYMINSTIDKLLPLILIMTIIPYVDYEKVKNCFYVVGVICMVGLLYHFVLIFAFGQSVMPITIPFLDMSKMQNVDYVQAYRIRPVSFFAEPAAYASFMLFPLGFCLIEKNVRFALIISVVTLLSTSSNGYFQTGAAWAVFLLSNRDVKSMNKIIIIAAIGFILYFVLNSDLFSFGVEKIQSIDVSDDDRISAGAYVFYNLSFAEKIFGVIAASPFDYLASNLNIVQGINISMTDSTVFLPMIWFYGIKYGIIGMIMVLACLFRGWRVTELKPLIVACLLSLFVQSTTLVLPMFVIMLYMYSKQHSNILISRYEGAVPHTISRK